MRIFHGIEEYAQAVGTHVTLSLVPGVELLSLTPTALGLQSVTRVTIEVDGSEKPDCVAETVAALVP